MSSATSFSFEQLTREIDEINAKRLEPESAGDLTPWWRAVDAIDSVPALDEYLSG